MPAKRRTLRSRFEQQPTSQAQTALSKQIPGHQLHDGPRDSGDRRWNHEPTLRKHRGNITHRTTILLQYSKALIAWRWGYRF
jgi:hypothetical protein